MSGEITPSFEVAMEMLDKAETHEEITEAIEKATDALIRKHELDFDEEID